MSINLWLNKLLVVYQYNGIPLSNQTEWVTDTYNFKDESLKHYAEYKKPARMAIYCVIPLW